MILEMSPLTFIHVVLSLIGIVAGFVVVRGMIAGERFDSWTAVFLATTALTSLTGFLFPFSKLLPSHIVGFLSVIVLAAALYARYATPQAGSWRTVYVIGAVAALYFNVFVLVAQLFMKVPALRAMAPTQSETPFLVAQLAVLAALIWLGAKAMRGYRSPGALAA